MKKYKLYFKNLDALSKSKEIVELFSKFGKVKSMILLKDPILFRSRGRGFIEMESFQNALECIEKLNGEKFMGKIISVSWASGSFAGA